MTWDNFFMGMAHYVSQKSKDPSTKIGAVIADRENRVVSVGYNGFPRGIVDYNARLENRDSKLSYTVHAELNAILNARGSVAGCVLYVCTLSPCSECAKAIIQAGIRCVMVERREYPERWRDNFKFAREMMSEADVEIYEIDPI